MKWWGQMPWSSFFVCWVLSRLSLSSVILIKRLFSSFLLSAIRVVSSAYLRLFLFLLAILILVCASSSPAFLIMYSAKVGSQEIPRVIGKFGLGIQNEAEQSLTEFCQENALVIANTLFQQHKRQLYTWTSPDGQYQNQIDHILWRWRWRSAIQSAKTRLGADCGSDH